MKDDNAKTNRILKLKMLFFKLHYIFIFIVYRPRRFFISKDARKNYFKNKEPLILVYNHVGFYDALTIWDAFIFRHIRFVAMAEIETTRASRFFFDWNGLILIDREAFSVSDFRRIVNAINYGYSVGIAPEGGINKNISFNHFMPGASRLARYTKTDVLPLYFVPNRKILFKRQHIHVGDIISTRAFDDHQALTDKMREAMEELRFNAFFKNKSYVYVLPIDYNIKEDNVRFKFYEKYNKDSATHQYQASKSSWYYLDLILKDKFGIILNPEDIKFSSTGKPFHNNISFNISHSEELIAIVISKENCGIDIQIGKDKKTIEWTKKEVKAKYSTENNIKIKTKKIKHNEQKYTLSVIASGKIKYSKRVNK